MVTRPLLYLLFVVLLGAGAYWLAVAALGGLQAPPFRMRAVAAEWPVPAGAAANPLWNVFPALHAGDRDRRGEAWRALLGAERARLPHPAAKPPDWPLGKRIFAHALLWRLWRDRSFRSGGLELRLDRDEDAPPPRVGEPARLRLSMASIAGTGRARFPCALPDLLEAGAEVHWITRPPDGLPEDAPPAPPGGPRRGDPPATGHPPLVLDAPRLSALPLRSAGRWSVRLVLDLRRARIEDARVPRGLWITRPLVLDVAPAGE